MSNNRIISVMVKERECCRQFIKTYETVRNKGNQPQHTSRMKISQLSNANKAVTSLLRHLRSSPDKPKLHMRTRTDSEYTSRLLSEITNLIEKALILEREVRYSMS